MPQLFREKKEGGGKPIAACSDFIGSSFFENGY
jgi:hypothetical protein